MPKPRKTEQERRAELAAKIAKIDERDAARKARGASEDVRRLERDLATLRRLCGDHGPDETFEDAIQDTEKWLADARAAALAAPGKGQS